MGFRKVTLKNFTSHILQTGFFRNIRFRIHQTPVFHLQGKTKRSAKDLSIVVATNKKNAYLFSQIAFTDEPKPELIGKTKLRDFEQILLDLDSDVTFVYENILYADFLSSKNFFVIPNIDFTMQISDPWETIIQRMCRTKRKKMRQMDKLGYEYEITKDLKKLRMFYDDLYKLHLQTKYGEYAGPSSFEGVKEQLMNGGLLLIKLDGEYVSGAIYRVIGTTLFIPVLSFGGPRESTQTSGVVLLYFLIRLGKEKGCTRIDYGGAFPSFTYGLFTYKKTCGMEISTYKSWDTRMMAVRFNNFDKGVQDFIADSPFVFDDGELKGLTIADVGDNLQSKYNTPGLSTLIVLSPQENSEYLMAQGAIPFNAENAKSASLSSLLGLASQKNYHAYELDFKRNPRPH